MIHPDKRQAIFTLSEQGHPKKKIAKMLEVDVKTVRKTLDEKERHTPLPRKDKIHIDEDTLRKEYKDCNGYLERLHEKLTEDYGYNLAYSTLTLRARELGLGQKRTGRSEHHPDVPGQETQYDTSPFTVRLNGKWTKVICSGLYMRYSKMRYIKFYRNDNRFNMKCFFYEALRFWGYRAKVCVIDNTCLAIWYGTGSKAVFHPEMVSFARNFGFIWIAHALGHANRKAGKERNFKTVITNFFAGRTFSSLEDLNRQAFQWATERFAKRPQSKTGLIPIQTFETEKAYLHKLPEYVPEPYHPPQTRTVSVYGYVAFEANYYWVPEFFGESKERIKKASIIRYANYIVLYYRNHELARYDLPPDGVRNERFAPEGVSLKYQPKNRKKPSLEEEKRLRAMDARIDSYVTYIRSKACPLRQKHHFIRRLFALSEKITLSLFLKTIERALQYGVHDIDTLSRIAAQLTRAVNDRQDTIIPTLNEDYKHRESYKQGRFNPEDDDRPIPDDEGATPDG